MTRTTTSRLALGGTVLLAVGLVAGNALTAAATVRGGLFRERIAEPGTYRLSAVLTALAAGGLLLLVGASARWVQDSSTLLVATASVGVSAGALLLLSGLRYAAPDFGYDTRQPYGQAVSVAASACAFAAFVALGFALLAAPGPVGAVRTTGRVAGAVCVLGPLAAAVVSAANPGAGFGAAVASTALAVLLVIAWGVALSVVAGRGENA